MNALQRQAKTSITSSPIPISSGVLQRQCACGNHTVSGEECDECRKEKLTLQRFSASRSGEEEQAGEVPPIVHEVLRSPGQPLDVGTRAFMEPRFGHDFSQVRVHTDAKAVESARAVNALAYTVGRDMVFGVGSYAPGTTLGCRLLMHELTHVMQQDNQLYIPGLSLHISKDDKAENEAEHIAFAEESGTTLLSLPVSLQRQQPKSQAFPGFSQGKYNSCGAASLISALMIWDKEKRNPASPNEMLVTACNVVLINMDNNKTVISKCIGDSSYRASFAQISDIRDYALQPNSPLDETRYENLAVTLTLLSQGFTAASDPYKKCPEKNFINPYEILHRLGLSGGTSKPTTANQPFEDFYFSYINPTLKDLNPGEIAQISWYSKTAVMNKEKKKIGDVIGPHSFLIGRFQNGIWFLSDQGPTPPLEIESASLPGLKLTLDVAATRGKTGIITGYNPVSVNLSNPPASGVSILNRAGVEKEAIRLIIKPGDFLAEVDAGILFTFGSKIYAWDFVARSYTESEAQKSFESTGKGHGGVIVEKSADLFHTYKTCPVSEANLNETKIDESDSKGGRLAENKFVHAWLKLCTQSKCNSSWFQVY